MTIRCFFLKLSQSLYLLLFFLLDPFLLGNHLCFLVSLLLQIGHYLLSFLFFLLLALLNDQNCVLVGFWDLLVHLLLLFFLFLNYAKITSTFSFYSRSISFIFSTNICAYLSCSSLCFSLSIYLCLIWSTITSLPLKAYSFFLIYISSCSLIFFSLYSSIILSFFFSWVLKSSQSLFFSSSCLSRMVAALAYATILFISFTSSSCYFNISFARLLIAPLFSSLSFSNSSKGNFFFFSYYSRSIYSRLALASDSLYSLSSSANLRSCYNSYLVGLRMVSFVIIDLLSFGANRCHWSRPLRGGYSFCSWPCWSPSAAPPQSSLVFWFWCLHKQMVTEKRLVDFALFGDVFAFERFALVGGLRFLSKNKVHPSKKI